MIHLKTAHFDPKEKMIPKLFWYAEFDYSTKKWIPKSILLEPIIYQNMVTYNISKYVYCKAKKELVDKYCAQENGYEIDNYNSPQFDKY